MSTPPQRQRMPQVNLLKPPPRGLWLPLPGQFIELGLIGMAVVVWLFAGLAIALLLGWRP